MCAAVGYSFEPRGLLSKEKPRLSVVDQTGQEVPGAGGRLFEDERAQIGQTGRSLTQDPAAALTYVGT